MHYAFSCLFGYPAELFLVLFCVFNFFWAAKLQTMIEAARAGNESDVARLFALSPSLVNARTASWYHETPLHLAAINGHDGVVAQLLALSPQSCNARDNGGRTVLHFAAEKGHDKIVARLLAQSCLDRCSHL